MPSGGGGGGTDPAVAETLPDLFVASLDSVSGIDLATTPVNATIIPDANIITNRGLFVVETGTGSRDAIKIPRGGTYHIDADLHLNATTTTARLIIYIDVFVTRAGADVATLALTNTAYYRGSTGGGDMYLTSSGTIDLQADDLIEIRASDRLVTSGVFTLGGENSKITIARLVGTPLITGGTGFSGGSTTTDRTRAEAIAFNSVPSTTTELRVQTVSSAGITVEFGDGPVEMLTASAGANTFTINTAGAYNMEWAAVISATQPRAEPCMQILRNSDNVLIGQIDPTYIRFIGGGAYHARRAGVIVIQEDNLVVRAVVENCRSDNAFSVAGGHTLTLIRGALGAMGEPGADGMGGGGGGDDAFDWATVGDTSLVPTDKLGTGAASVTTYLRGDGAWGTPAGGGGGGDDAFAWATVGNTDNVPDAKLPDNLLTGIQDFTYIDATRAVVLNFDRN